MPPSSYHPDRMVTTQRLNLRMFDESDAPALLAVLKGEDVLKYFPPGPPPSLDLAQRMIQRVLGAWKELGYGLWAVESSSSGEFLGRAGLQHIEETDEIEVDFIIDRRHWGRGLATEAGMAALDFGFGQMGFQRVVGIVHVDNLASRRVLEKIGMSHDVRTEYFGMVCDRYVALADGPG